MNRLPDDGAILTLVEPIGETISGPLNGGRSLLLPTVLDIIGKPKNLKIREIDAAQR